MGNKVACCPRLPLLVLLSAALPLLVHFRCSADGVSRECRHAGEQGNPGARASPGSLRNFGAPEADRDRRQNPRRQHPPGQEPRVSPAGTEPPPSCSRCCWSAPDQQPAQDALRAKQVSQLLVWLVNFECRYPEARGVPIVLAGDLNANNFERLWATAGALVIGMTSKRCPLDDPSRTPGSLPQHSVRCSAFSRPLLSLHVE